MPKVKDSAIRFFCLSGLAFWPEVAKLNAQLPSSPQEMALLPPELQNPFAPTTLTAFIWEGRGSSGTLLTGHMQSMFGTYTLGEVRLHTAKGLLDFIAYAGSSNIHHRGIAISFHFEQKKAHDVWWRGAFTIPSRLGSPQYMGPAHAVFNELPLKEVLSRVRSFGSLLPKPTASSNVIPMRRRSS